MATNVHLNSKLETVEIVFTELTIIGSYWTDELGNQIRKALIGDSVKFCIKTKSANNKKLKIKLYDSNTVLDTEILDKEFDATVVDDLATVLKNDMGKIYKEERDYSFKYIFQIQRNIIYIQKKKTKNYMDYVLIRNLFILSQIQTMRYDYENYK